MAKIIQDSTDIIRELQPNNVDLQLKLSNNVKNKFEYLEKALPHEDATGTDITMNNTAEYYIRTREIDGDTEQIITTGKNILKNVLTNSTPNGLTVVVNDDKSIKISGTASANTFLYLSGSSSYTESISPGTYTISGVSNGGSNTYKLEIALDSIDGTGRRYFSSVTGPLTVTIQDSGHTYSTYFIVYSGTTIDTTIYPMLVSGSTSGDYEPYTGGIPGPNPDYPQEVKVVKGINLWQNSDYYTQLTTANYTITETGFTFTRNTLTGGKYISKKIPVESGKTYIFSADLVRDPASDLILYLYRGNVYGTQLAASTTDVLTYTATADEELYFTFIINSGLQTATVSNIQVQTGERTSYLPYKSIGVKVVGKNLADINNISIGHTWSNATNTQRATILWIPLVEGERYTFASSYTNTHITQIRGVLNKGPQDTASSQIISGSFDAPSGWGYISIEIIADTTFTIDMLEGTKILFCKGNATIDDYEPYHSDVYPLYLGDTELCKIDGYQDCFKKSTGKNLFDNSSTPAYLNTTTTQKINTGIRVIDTAGSGNNHFALFKVLDVSNYVGETFSIKMQFQASGTNQGQFVVGLCDENGGNRIASKWGTTSGQEVSFTIPTITTSNYLALWLYSNASGTATANDYVDYTNIMINEGSTASEYEPYGIGVWYLHKETGKIVFDGSENWSTEPTNQTGKYRMRINHFESITNNNYLKPSSNASMPSLLSNYYIPAKADGGGTYGCNQGISLNQNTALLIYDNTYNTDDAASYKTWLSTHNLIVYYALATPTNTIVTDETLLQQLQDLDNATSYDDVTYLTTLGNLPPIVDITYFQDIKKLIAAATQS